MSSPTLCFATRSVGEFSETWMWRQIIGFRRFRTHVLTWRYKHRERFPLGDVPVTIQREAVCWPEKTAWFTRRIHRLRNLPGRNFFATTRREYAAIGKTISAIRPDVLLCQHGPMGLRMLPVAREFGIPLAVHFHGTDLAGALANPWYRWSLKSALHQFDAIIVVNMKQRDWLVEQEVKPEKIHVIPCGVPTDECVPPPAAERDEMPPRFIAVGRLVQLKGVDVTIRAFERVVSEVPQAQLVIVGEGPRREELEVLVDDLGLRNNVCFTGWLSQDEVRRALRGSNVFVQHSLVPEGWPVSVAEASAMGLPVVVTNCGGLAEQVVDGVTGLIVPMRDVRAMHEAMLKLARSPNLRMDMGMAGRTRMIQEFDVKKQIAKLEEALMSCVSFNCKNHE
ncbi:MAG: glycosyltransferase family 4 protein [Phycisphaerales bacterium]|nr:MAG: glycosyltransferase family 4 protein [Phycisphaerales bacterium]